MLSTSDRLSPPPLKRPRLEPYLSTNSAIQQLQPPSVAAAKKESCQLRIYVWNVNGISPLLKPDTPAITEFFQAQKGHTKPDATRSTSKNLREVLHSWQWPDIVCLQEVKIAASDARTQASVRRTVNVHLATDRDQDTDTNLYDAHFCLPTDKFNATGFGGKIHGVCMLVKRDLEAAKVRIVDWDLEGRVLICELAEHFLAIINVYAVNGTDFDYRDPNTGKVVGTRHDRKRDFHGLLAAEVQAYETKGWHVVVAGDINISRSEIDSFPQLRMGEAHVRNRADFHEKFMVDRGMLDTFRCLRGSERKYSYRPRHKPWGESGDRVDMILVMEGLRDDLLEADVLDTETDRGPSDHVPIYLKLQTWKKV